MSFAHLVFIYHLRHILWGVRWRRFGGIAADWAGFAHRNMRQRAFPISYAKATVTHLFYVKARPARKSPVRPFSRYTGCPPKKAERSFFVTLEFENIAYFYFIR